MNSIQDKYQKIMEVMSDKTFKIWLLVSPNGWDNEWIIFTYLRHYRYWDCAITNKEWVELSYDENELEIIWHPIHIWDVLDWMDKQDVQRLYGRHPHQRNLLIVWKDKRKPLQIEDTELIDYIYYLIA